MTPQEQAQFTNRQIKIFEEKEKKKGMTKLTNESIRQNFRNIEIMTHQQKESNLF